MDGIYRSAHSYPFSPRSRPAIEDYVTRMPGISFSQARARPAAPSTDPFPCSIRPMIPDRALRYHLHDSIHFYTTPSLIDESCINRFRIYPKSLLVEQKNIQSTSDLSKLTVTVLCPCRLHCLRHVPMDDRTALDRKLRRIDYHR